jgi:hypothetical protein
MMRASSINYIVTIVCLVAVGFGCNLGAQENLYVAKDPGSKGLRWVSDSGKTAFLQQSQDLVRWEYMLHYDVGDGSERLFQPSQNLGEDNKGLIFYRLQTYPTNLDNPDDTDGDGLHNLFELSHGYLPILTDSDDDGVADGDEDLDEDGESNLTEIANGTDASDSSSNSGDGVLKPDVVKKVRGKDYDIDNMKTLWTLDGNLYLPSSPFSVFHTTSMGEWVPEDEIANTWYRGAHHTFGWNEWFQSDVWAIGHFDHILVNEGDLVDYPIRRSYIKVTSSANERAPEPTISVVTITIPAGERESNIVELRPLSVYQQVTVELIPIDIVPDYNRDGMIGDADKRKVAEWNPFRWWVNDDDDQGVIRSKGSHNDIPEEGTADCTDLKVDGIRDVIDFFPLYLDIRGMLWAPPNEYYTYKLSHEDEAFNFGELPDVVLEGDPDIDGVGAYIRELSAAQEVANLPLKKASADGAVISEAMLDAFKQGRGVLILEATKETEKPLWLKIFKGSELLGEVSFPVKTSGVEKMFRCKNLVSAAGAEATEANRMGEPINYPDDLTNDKAFFMVHGYEPELDSAGNQKDARGFNAEIFKRLHQSGSRAKFVGVTWNGATGKDYHQAVINAFKTSGSMKGVAVEMGGNDIVVAAHSLGNVVTSNAISHEGFSPTHYFMVNAAVPIEAYDPGQTNGTGKQAEEMAKWMTHDKWKPYYDLGLQKLFSAEWHKLFSADDKRRKLTWKGRFSEVVPVAYNFYSSGEDVLENPNDQETVWKNLGTVIVRWLNGSGTGRHAWVSQEMAKGSDLASLIFLKRNHAGWKINFNSFDLDYIGYPIEGNYYSFFAEQAKLELEKLGGGRLSDENRAQAGFFWRFRLYDQAGGGEEKDIWGNLYGPIVDGNLATGNGFTQPNAVTVKQSSDEAERPEVQAELLASAIPAMSYAAGANVVDELDSLDRNFDMQPEFRPNGWPSPGDLGRAGLEEEYQGDWLHSDFWMVAPVYVQSVYLKWVGLAKLDKE